MLAGLAELDPPYGAALVLGHDVCHCKAAAVGDAHVQLPDAGFFHHVAGSGAEIDRWSALPIVADFDVAPADAPPPTGAERFEHGFLGGPAAGVVLCCCFAGGAVFDLGIGVDARDEELAVALDHLRDPQAFHNVDAGSDDGH